ncbi:hypothetical protein ACU81Q_00305 [Komagataeibacter melomenusus]
MLPWLEKGGIWPCSFHGHQERNRVPMSLCYGVMKITAPPDYAKVREVCPICSQGWVLVARDNATHAFFSAAMNAEVNGKMPGTSRMNHQEGEMIITIGIL